jgi:cytochrome c oxidase cbb3-type subunit 3
MSDSKEKLLDHNYDGIQEYDNPLPGWWLATFYVAIVFAFFYIGYYHFGPGPTPEADLAQSLADLKALDRKGEGKEPAPTEEMLAAIYQDAGRREEGKRIFLEKCSACHGAEGGGLIGPNLTDRYWLHGRGRLTDLRGIIAEGFPEKGMPSWELMLKKDDLLSVVVYVKSLQGTHPSNPKAPQGEEIKD